MPFYSGKLRHKIYRVFPPRSVRNKVKASFWVEFCITLRVFVYQNFEKGNRGWKKRGEWNWNLIWERKRYRLRCLDKGISILFFSQKITTYNLSTYFGRQKINKPFFVFISQRASGLNKFICTNILTNSYTNTTIADIKFRIFPRKLL